MRNSGGSGGMTTMWLELAMQYCSIYNSSYNDEALYSFIMQVEIFGVGNSMGKGVDP